MNNASVIVTARESWGSPRWRVTLGGVPQTQNMQGEIRVSFCQGGQDHPRKSPPAAGTGGVRPSARLPPNPPHIRMRRKRRRDAIAVAGGNLANGLPTAIPNGKHTEDLCRHVQADLDVAAGVHGHDAREGAGGGRHADVDENAGDREGVRVAGVPVEEG